MIQNFRRGVLFLLVFSATLCGQGRNSLIQSVNSAPGWTATGRNATYTESTLEALDAGVVRSLRIYGIDGVTVQEWHGPAGRVEATLFQMPDAGAAYGFFTMRRKAETVSAFNNSAGSESFDSGNHRYFWQAAYVVRLEGAPSAMDALAKILTENIIGRSQRPPIANHLPSANLVAGSEEYILDAADVPKAPGLDPSMLGFDQSAEAAVADYRAGGKTIRLLLVLYPTQQIAKKFADRFDDVAPNLALTRKRIGPLLAIVLGSTEDSIVRTILDQVHYESKVTWNEPPPGLGLGPIIVTVFTFIGILLVVCVVLGISFGGFRMLVKNRYSDREFGPADPAEMIQLHINQSLMKKELRD